MRTVYSGLVDESFIGQTVTLFGWAHRPKHCRCNCVPTGLLVFFSELICEPYTLAWLMNPSSVRP